MHDFADLDDQEMGLRKYHVKRFILMPQHWIDFRAAGQLEWERVKFCSEAGGDVPNDRQGVYTFVVEPGIADHPACHYLLYVGKARDSIRDRFWSYLREPTKKKPRPHIRRMVQNWSEHLWFYYAALDPKTVDINKLEDDLIFAYLPPFNRAFPATISEAIRAALS